MRKRILISVVALIVTGAFGVWYYVFQYSKTHHRSVESEEATYISPSQIVKEFETNENVADAKYLNKTIELRGIVLKKDKDQAGNTTITLASGDPLANIFCTLKPGIAIKRANSVVVVKGICTGFLSDVVLNDAILVTSKSN
jgi:hypothetical protein